MERCCAWRCAGKSAALILRHINPAAMAAARDLFDEETLQMLGRWSMKDAPLPAGSLERRRLCLAGRGVLVLRHPNAATQAHAT